MFYSNLAYTLITIFLFYKLILKEFNIFHVLIFVLPFHSWMYNIGLNLTIFQIVTIIMVTTSMFLPLKRKQNIFYIGNRYIVFFLLFAIIDTIIISVFFIDEFRQLGGFFRSEGRFLAQLILLLITFSIIPLAFNYIKNIQDVKKYLNIYLYALILLTMLGWLQYFTYSFTGLDLFPLDINQFGDIRTGMYGYEDMKIFRMSSLGGEPKGFSMSLILGFFIIHIFNRYGINFFKYDVILKYTFLFTAFATLSTSGMVLFTILLFIDFIYRVAKLRKIKIIKKDIIYSLIIVSVIGFFLIKYWDFVYSIIQKRVFERDVASEDYDAPIQIFLSQFPEYLLFGSGLGNIHNLAYTYIPYQFMHYMGDNIFVAKSGYLRIISELGLTGFYLFIYMVYRVYRRLGAIGNHLSISSRQVFYALQLLLVIVLIAFFARSYVLGEFIVVLSIANVLVYSKTIRQRNKI